MTVVSTRTIVTTASVVAESGTACVLVGLARRILTGLVGFVFVRLRRGAGARRRGCVRSRGRGRNAGRPDHRSRSCRRDDPLLRCARHAASSRWFRSHRRERRRTQIRHFSSQLAERMRTRATTQELCKSLQTGGFGPTFLDDERRVSRLTPRSREGQSAQPGTRSPDPDARRRCRLGSRLRRSGNR